MNCRRLAALATVFAAAISAPVAAQPAATPLVTWRAEFGCGSPAALARSIDEQLGRPLVAADGVRVTVDIDRSPIEREVHAHIALATARGVTTREVHGASCAAVVEAAAIVVAAAVATEPEPIRPPVPAPPVAGPRPGPSRYGPQPRLRLHLRLDGWSDAGTLPELRYGAGATVAASYARVRVELGGATWERDWVAGGGVSPFALGEIDLRACGAAWRVWLCGAGLVGRFTPLEGPVQRWSALSALVRWTRPLGHHAAVSASIEGLGILDRLRDEAGDTRLGTSPVAVRIGLGLEAIVF